MKMRRRKRVLNYPFAILTGIMSLFLSGAMAQEIHPEEGLIIYLPFTGNVLDESGNNVHTFAKGPLLTYDRHGNLQQALSFDGVNDYIELNHNEALITGGPFTLSMWARIKGRSKVPFGHSNSLFSQTGPEGDSAVTFHFDAEQNRLTRLEILSPEPEKMLEITTDYPGDHAWHHFLCLLDELNRMHIYIDGKWRSSRICEGTTDFQRGVSSVRIGSFISGQVYFGAFYGDIDEVCIFDRALNPCEVETIFSEQLLQER